MLLKAFFFLAGWLGGLMHASQTKAFVMLDSINKIDLAGLSPLP